MDTLETTQAVPLTRTKDGAIRITGSRVSLDSLVHHFKLGSTAEQIAQKFPSLALSDVHAVIAYYLTHRDAVEEYLQQQEAEGDAVRHKIETDPYYHAATIDLRRRLLERRTVRP